MNSLADVVNHIFEASLGIDNEKLFQGFLPLKNRIDAWYPEHSEDYFQERQILAIQVAVSKYCVISAVYKSKADLAFTCSILYEHNMLKLRINGKNIDTNCDKEKVMHAFLEMKSLLSYQGLFAPLRAHECGAADILPKDSDMIEKSRPLGSVANS